MSSTVSVSRRISAPITTVWQLATDIAGSPTTLTDVDSVELLSEGPFRAGTRWRETRTISGKPATQELWVSAVEPLRAYVVNADSSGLHLTFVFTFVPVSAGATEATVEFSAKPLTRATRLAHVVTGPMTNAFVRRSTLEDLQDLAAAAEASVTPLA